MVLLMGVFNAKVGKEMDAFPAGFLLTECNESNDNGVRLASLAAEARMVVGHCSLIEISTNKPGSLRTERPGTRLIISSSEPSFGIRQMMIELWEVLSVTQTIAWCWLEPGWSWRVGPQKHRGGEGLIWIMWRIEKRYKDFKRQWWPKWKKWTNNRVQSRNTGTEWVNHWSMLI